MNICTDAGFLIGLYDQTDQYHEEAAHHFQSLFESSANRLIVPWPVLYEAVSTRMTRRRNALALFERHWRYLLLRQQLELLSDLPFRDGMVEECFEEIGMDRYRALSAVDRVLRRMLSNRDLRIHAFITFNAADFVDVCHRFGRRLYP
jgi:predicted nucleic acid-binding protein